ncbi:hypothetical protein [Actinospica robiniae]|uniref:hypothetical protein n=1 Tax=Actinospica robiniae TaxID=304901 RepID=UPI000428D5B8|nr:hypothetical protein [Actinospica robiniae]
MDQSAQQFPQQWTPEPEPVDAPQQPVAAPGHQAPHYGAPAQYAPPPQQQYVPPQQYAQPQYPQQPYPPQQYPQPQYPAPAYPPPMPQQPYPQQQQYAQQQYAQPQYPQQPYPPQPPAPQQYAPPPPQYPQQPYPQQYAPPQQPYAPPQQQQQPQPQFQQQPPPQQAYVPPFGQSSGAVQAPMAPPAPPQQQPQYPQPQQPPAPQIPQQFSPSSSQSSATLPPMDQSGGAPVSFPPPPNLPKVRDAFLTGAGPFLQPGEQVFYGFMLKLDSTIEETPHELKIAIEGQHHLLGDINRASGKMNRGIKWAVAPGEALSEKLAEKATDAMFKALAGPVFVGGWVSQAGWLIRYIRATSEDYGPGAYGAVTNQRYLVFRGARLGGAAMRLVYAVPRTAIAGVRLEGGKEALKHGRTPRAELHFTDGSMVATMMPGKQGEQLAAVLQPPQY